MSPAKTLIEVLRLSQEINQRTRAVFDERQRQAVLREQLAAIQKELGEDDGEASEIAELQAAIDAAGMPEEVESQARKELRRLERTPDASAEYGMIRTYLEWLTELPWKLPEPKPIEIEEARRAKEEMDDAERRSIAMQEAEEMAAVQLSALDAASDAGTGE